MGPFKWSNRSDLAAGLVARDELANAEIAGRVGVSRATLDRWKAHPDFEARVDEHLEAYRQAVLRHGVAILERRVAALDDRWRRMLRIIEERAKDPEVQKVPGGSTGLLVRVVKGNGSGGEAGPICQFELDTGLLRELREHEKQAARELGQWTEKRQVGGDEARPVVVKVLKSIRSDEL